MFRIAVSHPRRLQSTISGFLDVEEVNVYANNMVIAHKKICKFASVYRLVIDASGAKIQAQDVLQAMGRHIATFPSAEKVGVVVGKSLNRYQALRLMDRPHVRFVDHLHEAQEWAFDQTLPSEALTTVVTGGSPA